MKSIKINDKYSLEFDGTEFKVGCQRIEFSKAKDLARFIQYQEFKPRCQYKCNVLYELESMGYRLFTQSDNGHVTAFNEYGKELYTAKTIEDYLIEWNLKIKGPVI